MKRKFLFITLFLLVFFIAFTNPTSWSSSGSNITVANADPNYMRGLTTNNSQDATKFWGIDGLGLDYIWSIDKIGTNLTSFSITGRVSNAYDIKTNNSLF